MKLCFILLLGFSLLSFQKEGEEVEAIDRLISMSQEQLKIQQELKQQILQFKREQELFVTQEQPSKEKATELVKMAASILKTIQRNHYQHLFSPVYLEELAFFSSIAHKPTPSRP